MPRIEKHPILEFKRRKPITFYFNGKPIRGYSGETVAAALHAAGIMTYNESLKFYRPRGFFCAIGRCSSCFAIVNGIPNTKLCVTSVKPGLKIKTQKGIASFEKAR